EIPGNGDVDEEERAPLAAGERSFDVLSPQHESASARRREDDVDLSEVRGDRLEGDRATAEAQRERPGVGLRAVRHERDGSAARGEAAGGELADPPGADQEDATAREVAEDLLGERGGRGGDRGRTLAD